MQNNILIIVKLFLLLAIPCLNGCKPEQNYRGVPAPVWEHLNAEQKQLIVDRAFKDEIEK